MSDRRRELLEEILRERARVVAELPVTVDEEHASSPLWGLGIARLGGRAMSARPLLEKRRRVLLVTVVGLAWLEAIDAALDRLEVSPDAPFADPANRPS